MVNKETIRYYDEEYYKNLTERKLAIDIFIWWRQACSIKRIQNLVSSAEIYKLSVVDKDEVRCQDMSEFFQKQKEVQTIEI